MAARPIVVRQKAPMRPMRGAGIGERERALKRRRMRQWLTVVAIVSVLGLLHVWSRVAVLGVRYQLSAVDQRHAELRKQIAQYDGKIGGLKSVDRLVNIATTQLHMAPPQPQQIVMVQMSGGTAP